MKFYIFLLVFLKNCSPACGWADFLANDVEIYEYLGEYPGNKGVRFLSYPTFPQTSFSIQRGVGPS